MALTNYIDWQVSTRKFGYIEQGVDDINQTILLILSTMKGSDPLRPEFGSDIWQYLDQPITTAPSFIVTAVRNDIGIWEKRISILSVKWSYAYNPDDSSVIDAIRVDVGWKFVNEELNRLTVLLFNAGTNSADLDNGKFIRILATEGGLGIDFTGNFLNVD